MKKNDSITRTTLANGIRILTKKMPFARSVSMGVWVHVGARNETAAENGLSHLLEHMIFKGTEKRSAFQIAKEFDAIGGHTNAFTTMETTCYHARVMDTHVETMVDILSDIFLNSAFDQGEVEKERPVILQELCMMEDIPDDYIHLLAAKAYWGDNPLGRSILGKRDNLLRFNSETLKSFFHKYYQPTRIYIAVAGNLEHDYILNLTAPAFEKIKPGKEQPPHSIPKGRYKVEFHQRDLEQAHICIGTRGLAIGDPRRYAYSLLNTILGGNMSSRLFQEIREKRGLAYAIYSFISSYKDTGMFGTYVGVDPKKTSKSISLIMNEMRSLKNRPVSDEELNNAKEFTKGNLLLASESIDNQMARLAQNEIHFGRYLTLKEVEESIDAVTADDIQKLAAYLYQNDELALTVLGPAFEKKSIKSSFGF